jgi:hypothetical protein
MEANIPLNAELLNSMDIDTCVGNFSGSILSSLATSTPKCRPRGLPAPQITAGVEEVIRLKNRLRKRWHFTKDSALRAEVNRLQRSVARELNEWMNDRWITTLEFLIPVDQSLWRMTKRVMRVPTPSPPLVTPVGSALSDCEKAEYLADSLEAQFRAVTVPSVPAVIELVHTQLESYFQTRDSEAVCNDPDEVENTIRGLKVGTAPGPNGITNMALKHLSTRAVLLLFHIFNCILRIHYFPPVFKHARVIFILKTEKNPAQHSSYQHIIQSDTIGKLFEKMLLTRILHQEGECGFLRDDSSKE